MSGAEQVRGVSGAEGPRGLLMEGLVGHREDLCFSQREMEGQPGRVLSQRVLLVLTPRLIADYGVGGLNTKACWGCCHHPAETQGGSEGGDRRWNLATPFLEGGTVVIP